MSSKDKKESRLRNASCWNWKIDPDCRGMRLQSYLARQLRLNEADAADLIDFGSVYLGGKRETDPSRHLSGEEEIKICWSRHGRRRYYEIDPNRIVYRDRFLLAYNKEAGIPSQEVPSDAYNNLFAALHRYLKKTSSRCYIALHHRLDMETSGVIVFALDRSVNRKLGEIFQQRRVGKDYLVWVEGRPSEKEWTASEDITRRAGRYTACAKGEGKAAETNFRLLYGEKDRSLLLARPLTGRTHQIRLHLAAAGHPVIGDRLYGGKAAKRLYLHAYRLRLPHPATGSELVLSAPVLEDWPLSPPESIPD